MHASSRQPEVAGNGGIRLERRLSAIAFIETACEKLPVRVKEVFESKIFAESDLSEIESGAYSLEAMRLYIASWLSAGKAFPFV